MCGKVLMAIGIYLALVGIAQYVSESSTNSPTADKVASFPSLGSSSLDLLAGGGILIFHKQISHLVGATA